MAEWNHQICSICWTRLHPDNPAPLEETGEIGVCCFCGRLTNSGIVVREDPASKVLMCGGLHLTDEQIVSIWQQVLAGRGFHGDFLKSLAGAVVRADHENLPVLRSAALHFIRKYKLQSYLEGVRAK
jgi:hypothetical protein